MKVAEIFRSIQGESYLMGLPCTFVRLAGCNLRCAWCDTSYAWDDSNAVEMTVGDVLDRVRGLGADLVEITGGEPLLQQDSLELMRHLCDMGSRVLLETNGTQDVGQVDPRVRVVMDVKPPSSGHVDSVFWDNVGKLSETDEIKVIIADRRDYEWARDTLTRKRILGHYRVTFSATFGGLEHKTLAEWLLADALPVRLGIQLHKLIWGPDATGV